jgi:hypothetical protein
MQWLVLLQGEKSFTWSRGSWRWSCWWKKGLQWKGKKICSGYSLSGGDRLVVVLTNRGGAIGEEANNKVAGGCIS